MPFVNGAWVDWVLIDQNATNVTNIAEATAYVNYATNYLFGYCLLLIIFITIFLAGIKRPLTSLATSMMVTTVVGYLMAGISLVGFQPLVGYEAIIPLTIGLVGSIVLLYKGGESGGI